MENAGAVGYQLSQELVPLRKQVRRIIHDDVIPAEGGIDPDAAKFSTKDYWAIAKKTQNVRHGLPRRPRIRRIGQGASEVHRMVIARID